MENKVMVESTTDWTVGIANSEYHINRTWYKKGMKIPFEREVLEQLYYEPGVEALFRDGSLTTDDKQFLEYAGLLNENNEPIVLQLNDKLMQRMIQLMPLAELKVQLTKLTKDQVQELFDYAVDHNDDLRMDRVDVLSRAAGRDLMRTVINKKAELEA